MVNFKLDFPKNVPLRLLCLGAHCDDIEIGCGGTILNFVASRRELEVYWNVFSSNKQRKKEALMSANLFLANVTNRNIAIHTFRDGYLPYLGSEIKDLFEELKVQFKPDLILTHYRQDLHQDHRIISELTWNTFRDHFILEYEIPKYDGDLGAPNFFISLHESICQKKISYIVDSYHSQREKRWFNQETFRGLLTLRGIESNAADKYAEAFYCRKMVIAPTKHSISVVKDQA